MISFIKFKEAGKTEENLEDLSYSSKFFKNFEQGKGLLRAVQRL